MTRVLGQDVAWLRQDDARAGTLGYAIPYGFEAYGVLDLPEDIRPVEEELLSAIAPDPAVPLIAGWIDRGPWAPPGGDEHTLYTGWRYRLRRATAAELAGLPTEGEGGFSDLLFPTDRAWLLSLLWDDGWRSIGSSQVVADRLAARLQRFHQLDPDASLADTGRIPN